MRDRKSATGRTSRRAIQFSWCFAAAIALTWAISLSRGHMWVDGSVKGFTLQLADGVIAASWPSASQWSASAKYVHDTYIIMPRGLVGPPTFGLILPSIGSSMPIGMPLISFVFVPLWLPFLLTLLAIAILVIRNRRRIPVGHCPQCRYDLTGNTSGVCPECGLAVPPRQQKSKKRQPIQVRL